MQTFLVGGAVRDILMGLPARDRDYVVVGARPEEMLAKGFKQVGADFPVFLHPDTGEEYALARTERKTGPGYHGFAVHSAPDVSLEDDLARRDLTINAMAVDDTDHVVDPFGGQEDLAAKVLRHVGPAFAEDPVRILRVARFAARYTDFSVHPDTMRLMQAMVANGEVDNLVPERVWAEMAKGLMEQKPSRMLDVLHESGALARIMPELDRLFGVPQPLDHHPEGTVDAHLRLVLDYAAEQGFSLEVRFAALVHDLGKGVTPSETWPAHHKHEQLGVPLVETLAARMRVPSASRDLAVMAAELHTLVHRVETLTIGRVVKLLREVDAFRRPERFDELLRVAESDARGRLGMANKDYPQADWLRRALAAANAVDAGAVARSAARKGAIPDLIHAARVSAVKASLAQRRA